MNANNRKVPTRFAPDTRFEITPISATPFRAVVEDRFESLRHRLLLERLAQLADPRYASHVRRAANEAAALSWLTAYPLLVFPALFEEKTFAAVGCPKAHAQVAQPVAEIVLV